ncbi:Lipase (class 3) family protein [Leishmania donovani]|uniref:Lipase (Class 3) family protein n=1 Tax=Leishmania donovani TaxID=5661 RepID=A0A504XT55_LEIDO|nr:Lipase (class 3) family protein [Leishmania donovani]
MLSASCHNDEPSAATAGQAPAGRGQLHPSTPSCFSAAPDVLPVELQVETMSSLSSRVFLYVWYAVLVVALVVQSNVRLQWSSRNFCGAAEEVSVYHLDEWNSSACLTWEAYWTARGYSQQQQWMSLVGAGVVADTTRALESGDSAGYRYVAWPPMDGVLRARSACGSCNGGDAAVPSEQCLSPHSPQEAREVGSASVHQRAATSFSPPDSSLEVRSAWASSGSAMPLSPLTGPTMPPLHLKYKLRWTAQALSGVLDHQLNRFLHVFISLASPLAIETGMPSASATWGSSVKHSLWGAPQRVYEVLVALEETSLAPCENNSESSSGGGWGSDGDSSSMSDQPKYVYTYRASVTCRRDAPRCSNIVLPSSVVIPANHSQLTLTLIDVDAELAEASLRSFMIGHGDDDDLDAVPTSRLLACEGALAGAVDSPCTHQGPAARRTPLASNATPRPAPSSAVGVMYQRSQYTIGTLVFRYFFLLVTLVSMLRFLYSSRQAHRMRFEQKWTLTAQIGLIFYLNPVYWWCIYAGEGTRRGSANGIGGANDGTPTTLPALARFLLQLLRLLLYYVEFHVPTHFAALIVCYVWSIIAGSFRWRVPTNNAAAAESRHALHPPAATRSSTSASAAQEGDPQPSARSSHVSAADLSAEAGAQAVPSSKVARFRARVFLLSFLALVTSLDVAKCCLEEKGVGGSELTCKSPMCLRVDKCIGYLLLCGILSSGVGLYWLRRNLARHPYLSTRPQQLACRIMIFMYFTGGIYSVAQVALLDALYAQLLGVIYYQPLVQLPHLLVLTSLVNHMTYVYTTTQSSLQIPLRPNDPRWKRVGWSSRWYRWLNSHGGSLYVFFSEAEERLFYDVQVAYQLANGRDINAAGVEGLQGGNHFTPPLLPPDAGFVDPPSREESDWLPPFDMAGRRLTLSTITTHPSTSSWSRMAYADNGDSDEQIRTHDNSSSPNLGRSVSCEDEPRALTASCNSADTMPGGGLEVGGTPALPQPLSASDADDAAAGCSFLLSQSGGAPRYASSRAAGRMPDPRHGAESRLVDGTATFLDFLAETSVDRPLRVRLRQRARQSFVFFNLETAIDCLNLSREAYAVQESRGDKFICTGIQVNAAEVPRVALGFVERVAMALLGLCFKPSPHVCHALDDSGEEDAAAAISFTSGDDRTPLLDERATAAGASSSSSSPSKRIGSFPTSASAATANAGADTVRLPHMNVEQYGYHRVAVLETRGVQVVVVRMDTSGSCPVHVGKAPRLVIAFRGTDNVANVMEDIRFRQRTWKEMETPTLSSRASVHSGFLELWMSLKERVIDVVLRELRSQCTPFEESSAEVSAAGTTGHAEEGASTAAGRSPSRAGHDMFHTTVPFSDIWTLRRNSGGRGCADPREGAFGSKQGGSEGFMRVYVTGHSLGGALASLCAYTLRRMLLLIQYPEPDLVVYTFGQPRIGNFVFKQYYNRAVPCTFRVVNESDAVSGFNFFGGHHVGVQVNIDRHGNYICKPMYIERMFRPTRGRGFALANHTISAYASSLNAMANVYTHGACPLRCRQPYMGEIVSVSSTNSEEDTRNAATAGEED